MKENPIDYKGFLRDLGVEKANPNYRRVKRRHMHPDLVEGSVRTSLTSIDFQYPPGEFGFRLEVDSGRLYRRLSGYELNHVKSPITPEEIEKVSSVARQHGIAFDVEKARWNVDEESLHEHERIRIVSF